MTEIYICEINVNIVQSAIAEMELWGEPKAGMA